MKANAFLDVLRSLLAPITIPVQIVTTFVLGLLVTVTFGLLLLPISLIWAVLLFPMVGVSRLCAASPAIRTAVGFVGIPWALLTVEFACLMPSMGELESRSSKIVLAASWPFTHECWEFMSGRLDLDSQRAEVFRAVIARVTRGDPLATRVVEKVGFGQQLDAPT